MKAKVLLQWAMFLLAQTVIFYLFLSLFLSPSKPVRFSEIPKETINFFNNLPDFIDIGFHFNPNPDPFSWGKYFASDSLLSIEDSCFIVFYSAPDSVDEHPKAEYALSQANAAIPRLKSLMKDYPYPYQVKNRRLPIYIANTNSNYVNIQTKLTPNPSKGSVGVYIFEYSSIGSLAKGIVLSPEAWNSFDSDEKESFRITLWHEMNHYVYFTYFNFFQNIQPYLWFTEGCAEFFAGNEIRNKEIDVLFASKYTLYENQPSHSSYWIGYTAYSFFNEAYSQRKLSDLISASYQNDLSTSLKASNNIDLNDWENGWKGYIKKKKSLFSSN
jgi:hypothetical protein